MTKHTIITTGAPLSARYQQALSRAASMLFETMAEVDAAETEEAVKAQPKSDSVKSDARQATDGFFFAGVTPEGVKPAFAADNAGRNRPDPLRDFGTFLLEHFGDRVTLLTSPPETSPIQSAQRILVEQKAEIDGLRNALAAREKQAIEERYIATDEGMVSKDHIIEMQDEALVGRDAVIGYLEEKLGIGLED